MTTEELKLKLKQIKSRYYYTDATHPDYKKPNTNDLKIYRDLESLLFGVEIWDISSVEPYITLYRFADDHNISIVLTSTVNKNSKDLTIVV